MYNRTNESFKDGHFEERLNKREKREKKRKSSTNTSLSLNEIQPKTKNQTKTFVEYGRGSHLLLQGVAGTGKTFISIYLALQEILSQKIEKRKLIIIRSVVPTRDLGFLPGNQKEKQKAYELPYYNIFTELFGRGDAYEYLKNHGMVEFITTSFIRGTTLDNCIVIVDESQNLDGRELNTVITRIGKNSRLIFSGDCKQSDFTDRQKEKNDIHHFISILRRMNDFAFIEFNEEDIVRSDLVKAYLVAKNRYPEKITW